MMVFSFIQLRLTWEDFEARQIQLNAMYKEQKEIKN